MSNGKRKYVWLGAAGAALATLLVYVSIFWPPVPRSWVQGAIGKRDVLRQATLTDQDIGVAGTVQVTVDDIQTFLKSPEFKSLASDPQFNQLIADPKFQKAALVNFTLSAAQAQNSTALNLAQLAQSQAMVQGFMNKALSLNNKAQLSLLMATPGLHAMLLNNQFTQLASQSQLSKLVGNAALQTAMASSSGAQPRVPSSGGKY